MVAILDFGSQYTQLIVRRIRECGIYSEIFPYSAGLETLESRGVKAVILSGGPGHVHSEEIVKFDTRILDRFYILGVCYGMQLLAEHYKGKVSPGNKREYGENLFYPEEPEGLFSGVKRETIVWMSHWDYVSKLPAGFKATGKTDNTRIAAMRSNDGRIHAVQFHPEVMHTGEGGRMLKNFLCGICGMKKNWSSGSMLKKAREDIKKAVGNEKIICALSGGVDSSCLASIIHEVCGKNSLCVFINNGLLRKGEHGKIVDVFSKKVNLRYIDASDLFMKRLKGVANPERKRKIIGNTFIRILEKKAVKFGARHLAQGTLYPDVIESISPHGGPSAKIKTHHNVGGLPEKLHLSLVEPFRYLFKDEVRQIGKELMLPDTIINRHPFPGPGLAVRIIGSVSPDRIEILRNADAIVMEEIKASGLYLHIWQAFAVLLPVKSVGVMGDMRTYENVIALRMIKSADGMTADWYRLPHRILSRISCRIVNEVKGVNRVVYDITSKPPATIEWE